MQKSSKIYAVAKKAPISNLQAYPRNGGARLTFTAPFDADSVTLEAYSSETLTYSAIDGADITNSSSSALIYSLNNEQNYKFRLVVDGGFYEGESNIAEVTPSQNALPTISTIQALDLTTSSAVVSGSIVDDGGHNITGSGLEYKKHGESDYKQVNATNVGLGDFTIPLSGLTSDTTYDVRAFASSEAGTSYGNIISFCYIKGYRDKSGCREQCRYHSPR